MIGVLGGPLATAAISMTTGLVVDGAQVAADGWTQALHRYGSQAEYEVIGEPAPSSATGAQFRWRALDDIPGLLGRGRYDVLHSPQGPDLGRMVAVATRCSASQTCLTAVQYSVSYAVLNSVWLDMLTGPPRPWDCLICTSVASMRAQQGLLDHLRGRLADSLGVSLASVPTVRLAHIPLGVEPDRFWGPGDRLRARTMLDLPPDRPVLLSVGRFTPINKADLELCLRVLAALRRRDGGGNGPLLVLAGSDRVQYADSVRRLAHAAGLGEHVRLFTDFPPVLAPALYAAADIFLAVSDSVGETFGITIAEAMASGVPVVAPRWDGFAELVADGETGFLVDTAWMPPNPDLGLVAELRPGTGLEHLRLAQATALDGDQLVACVSRLLDDGGLRRQMGERGRARVDERFSWREVIRQYEELWAALRRESTAAGAEPRRAFEAIPYSSAFGHYPSRLVTGAERVVADPAPLLPLETMLRILGMPALGLDADLLRRIMRLARRPVSVRRLTGGDARRGRHLMWLYKHGFVRVQAVEAAAAGRLRA